MGVFGVRSSEEFEVTHRGWLFTTASTSVMKIANWFLVNLAAPIEILNGVLTVLTSRSQSLF